MSSGVVVVAACVVYIFCLHAQAEPAEESSSDTPDPEAVFLRDVRQLTFDGRRTGEGYFSPDGGRMVFQSEREPGNPFYQIYLMDLQLGDVERVSTGVGKTTCGWIHPDGNRILFASTHEDPAARRKQEDELKLRAQNKQRRYAWDYDEHYDLFARELSSGRYTKLTDAPGYDAEGSYSPDGRWIAFSSNRRAYEGKLSDEQRRILETDPSYFMDIYIMKSDGSDLKRLTAVDGYDGGPFFSPDGRRICWRRFSKDGASAEIMTMRADGTDQKQLTNLGAMSWAPYYHPSGRYLIFTTNVHGFANFELYLIDAEGGAQPVRATFTDGFDGLPVFTPDGRQLAWSTGRTTSKRTQIFLSTWNHDAALSALGLEDSIARSAEDAAVEAPVDDSGARAAAKAAAERTKKAFAAEDVVRHVAYLCRPELAGRLTGTPGEKLATSYVAAYFDHLGLLPAGDDGFFETFEFTAGVDLAEDNRLVWNERAYAVDDEWRPLAFSQVGEVAAAPVVFAGYGIVAPAYEDQAEYDSYVHLDVSDKWVVVLRFMPEQLEAERRQHLSRHSSLRFKAMVARDKGARGLIIVSGPNSQVRHQLARLHFDGSPAGTSIPVVSVTDKVAQAWFDTAGMNLGEAQTKLDSGDPVMGQVLSDVQLAAMIDIRKVTRVGRNVLARLPAGAKPSRQQVVLGAHIDHLGKGGDGSSLAREQEKDQIHYGADDNASGVAAMMEIAEYLLALKSAGKFRPRRDIVFAAWSGEELGLLGSNHYVKGRVKTRIGPDNESQKGEDEATLYPEMSAYLNMDMVGRLDKKLVLQGVGSSSVWPAEIERCNAPVGLPIAIQNDSYLPTDATTFFLEGVPILAAFTGAHEEYHTPRDTPETLNYEGTARIANFMALVLRRLALREQPPDYVRQEKPDKGEGRANLRAYLGTIPDYAETDVKGVKLSGVAKGGPADKAGVRGGDMVVQLAGRTIENIYDYTYAIEALKVGQAVDIGVNRGNERLDLTVTPDSRQ
jgi:Tol biopolymer transport system component